MSKNTFEVSPEELALILTEAKDKHTSYEVANGPDPHWEKWYANFVLYRLGGLSSTVAAGWATIDNLSGSSL